MLKHLLVPTLNKTINLTLYFVLSSGSDGLEGRMEDAQFPTASALRQSALMQHCPLRDAPKCPPASKRYLLSFKIHRRRSHKRSTTPHLSTEACVSLSPFGVETGVFFEFLRRPCGYHTSTLACKFFENTL